MSKAHICPICRKTIWIEDPKGHPKSPHFPFCSERCKLVDLGSWFDGHYKIVSDLKESDGQPPEGAD